MAAPFQASHASFPNLGSDGRREEPYRSGGEVSFKNPTQITERFPDGQGIGVLVPKPHGGHTPWLDVGVAVKLAMTRITLQWRVPWCSYSLL